MQEETIAAVGKAAGGAVLAGAFTLTPWAVAAAFCGAAAALHFQESSSAKGVVRILLGIAAVGFLAAMLAAAAPHLPLLGFTDAIPVAVRAGLLGVVASPTYTYILAPAIAWFGTKFKTSNGG